MLEVLVMEEWFLSMARSMHEDQWDGTEYNLYSPRLEPRGPDALPPPLPKDEYSLGNVFGKEANIFAEYTGLYGFVAKSAYQGRSLHPAGHKKPRACATGRSPIRPAIHATPLPGSLFLYIKWKAWIGLFISTRTGSIIWIRVLLRAVLYLYIR